MAAGRTRPSFEGWPGQYEHHAEPLIPRRLFYRRMARHGAIASALVVGSLLLGTVGFHELAPQEWIDAFLNAAMLLGGMGPVGTIERPVGKIFAALYALYAGLVFLGVAAILFTPIAHRVLHKLHADDRPARK